MKPTRRVLAVTVAGVVVVGFGGWMLHLRRQAAALPPWYVEAPPRAIASSPPEGVPPSASPDASAAPSPRTAPSAGWTWEPAEAVDGTGSREGKAKGGTQPGAGKRGARAESASVLRDLHRRPEFARARFAPAIRGSRATFRRGVLEVGVVLELEALARMPLPPSERRLADRLLEVAAVGVGQEVYLALEDRPNLQGGVVQLTEHAKVRVGEVGFSLESLGTTLGVPPASLLESFNAELRRVDFRPPP